MISVIIPTYKEPEALELCIKSCQENQIYNNEIIVVVDGTYEYNKQILEKFVNIDIYIVEKNKGLSYATNFGVNKAHQKYVLIVNDDNVFPKKWDKKLLRYSSYLEKNWVISPNQIEPYNSMFKDFIIKDFGRNPKTFNYEEFLEFEESISKNISNLSGSTLPIFISTKKYKELKGWDENYPTNGIVADWDFFLRCNLAKMKFMRIFNIHFYHFVSLSVPNEKQRLRRKQIELKAHEYARNKWGSYIKHNPTTNLKYI